MAAASSQCELCSTALQPGLAPWHWRCPGCGLETTTLEPGIDREVMGDELDEDKREQALRPIRNRNFAALLLWILDQVKGKMSDGKRLRLLDVGCAHGWFIEKAAASFDVLGLEPDPFIAERTRQRAIPVRLGYFPQAIDASEIFDIIVFNDVLEHIPQARNVLLDCIAHLTPDGLIVVNAPDRRGIFYRLSKVFHRLGWPGPFNRMWQTGLPSPHLYYFDTASMTRLAEAAGLRVHSTRRLPSLTVKGLYSRIRAVKDLSVLQSRAVSLGSLMLIPVLRLLPSDISVWFLLPATGTPPPRAASDAITS